MAWRERVRWRSLALSAAGVETLRPATDRRSCTTALRPRPHTLSRLPCTPQPCTAQPLAAHNAARLGQHPRARGTPTAAGGGEGGTTAARQLACPMLAIQQASPRAKPLHNNIEGAAQASLQALRWTLRRQGMRPGTAGGPAGGTGGAQCMLQPPDPRQCSQFASLLRPNTPEPAQHTARPAAARAATPALSTGPLAAAAAARMDQGPSTKLVKPRTKAGKRALEKRAPKLVRRHAWRPPGPANQLWQAAGTLCSARQAAARWGVHRRRRRRRLLGSQAPTARSARRRWRSPARRCWCLAGAQARC